MDSKLAICLIVLVVSNIVTAFATATYINYVASNKTTSENLITNGDFSEGLEHWNVILDDLNECRVDVGVLKLSGRSVVSARLLPVHYYLALKYKLVPQADGSYAFAVAITTDNIQVSYEFENTNFGGVKVRSAHLIYHEPLSEGWYVACLDFNSTSTLRAVELHCPYGEAYVDYVYLGETEP